MKLPQFHLFRLSRWFGPAGLIAFLFCVLARILVEPIRDLPHFDDKGMDAYSAVEHYKLEKRDKPFDVAVFGSSVAVWGIIPEVLADSMGVEREKTRHLAVEGGTPFDMWNLIRRNEDRFNAMKVALIEINPRSLNINLEGDPRMILDLTQHATLAELRMLRRKEDRRFYYADELLPLHSLRRPLKTLFLNLYDPEPGSPLFPLIDSRLRPFDWAVPDPDKARFTLKNPIPVSTVARRISSKWKPSKLLDHSLREMLAWMKARKVRVIFFQMPIHPKVVEAIRTKPEYATGYDEYEKYLRGIGVTPENFIQYTDIAECGIPEKGLRDHTHLNELGATIFCKLLGERAKGMLPVTK